MYVQQKHQFMTDAALWSQFKVEAAKDGRPMSEILRMLIRHFLTHGLPTED